MNMIVTTGFNLANPIRRVARNYPAQKYLLVDVDGVNLPSVMRAVYAEHEGSYLVGAAVALKARADGIANPHFGFIWGGKWPNYDTMHFEYRPEIFILSGLEVERL